jgi:hypothetical protein
LQKYRQNKKTLEITLDKNPAGTKKNTFNKNPDEAFEIVLSCFQKNSLLLLK